MRQEDEVSGERKNEKAPFRETLLSRSVFWWMQMFWNREGSRNKPFGLSVPSLKVSRLMFAQKDPILTKAKFLHQCIYAFHTPNITQNTPIFKNLFYFKLSLHSEMPPNWSSTNAIQLAQIYNLYNFVQNANYLDQMYQSCALLYFALHYFSLNCKSSKKAGCSLKDKIKLN